MESRVNETPILNQHANAHAPPSQSTNTNTLSHDILFPLFTASSNDYGESRLFLHSYGPIDTADNISQYADTSLPLPFSSVHKSITSLCSTHTTKLPTSKAQPFSSLSSPLGSSNLGITDLLKEDPNIPSEIPGFKETAGKFGLMFPRTFAKQHKAADMLEKWAMDGCPVDAGDDWTLEHIMAALLRGPHQSAYQDGAIEFLRKETIEKCQHGYARVVKWKDIKNNIPKNLKISPVAMVPHKSKLFRVILDLSFRLRKDDGTYWESVNSATNKQAPPSAMHQLGNCVRRIIAMMADHFDITKPFYFTKLDVKDGFWRMAVNDEDAWNFCYVLPSAEGDNKDLDLDEIELVVPNSLQMGWSESPPYFCAASETARDVIEILLPSMQDLPQHELEDLMMQKIDHHAESTNSDMSISSSSSDDDMSISSSDSANSNTSKRSSSSDSSHIHASTDKLPFLDAKVLSRIPTPSLNLFEVFVDDFIAATNNSNAIHLRHLARTMLHSIHSVFPPPSVTGHPGGDSVSVKKILKGEGQWDTEQEILGWIMDGVNYTIRLSDDKMNKMLELLTKFSKLRQIPLNDFQKLTGKLQHASLAMPGGWGLFSPLYMAMKGDPKYINMTPLLRQTLRDWRTIIKHISKVPTHVLQIVSGLPDYLGYVDACKRGCGGVWFGLSEYIGYIVWRFEFPPDFQAGLITPDNPSGWITINDLELIGIILEWLALEIIIPSLIFKHLGINCDNTSAVSWTQKFCTTKSRIAARLLRVLSLRMHKRRASSVLTEHYSGEYNGMADCTSRSFKDGTAFSLNNKSLTDFFNEKFPLPQSESWRELVLPPELTSRVISCVRSETFNVGSLLRLPRIDKNTGNTGAHMYETLIATTPSFKLRPKLKTSSWRSGLLNGSGQEVMASEIKSKFQPSVSRWRPSARPSNWLDNKVPSTKLHKNTSNP